jgi:hypothetical protein
MRPARFVIFRVTGDIYWGRSDGTQAPRPLIEAGGFLNQLAVPTDGGTLGSIPLPS